MPHRLTPEAMLSLPRPGGAVPNASGTFFIVPYSHFSFDTQRTQRNVAIQKIDRSPSAAGKDTPSPVVDLLSDLRYSEVVWLDDETVLYLRPRGSEVGKPDVDTSLSDNAFKKAMSKQEDPKPGMDIWCKTLAGVSYRIGEVPVEISDLKVVQTSPTRAILALSAEVYPENPDLDAVAELDKKYQDGLEGADVQVFDRLFIRHWDTWTTQKKKLVFILELEKKPDESHLSFDDLDIQSLPGSDEEEEALGGSDRPPHWSILTKARSPLAGLDNVECPTRPFGDKDDYDLTPSHLVFVSKDPNLPEAWHTRMHVYLVPFHPKTNEEKKPKCLTSQGGARSFPVFSASAKVQPGGAGGGHVSKGKIAWLEMRKDGYEADRNRIMIYDIEEDRKYGITEDWDRSPVSLAWGQDDDTLFAAAEDEGHKKLFLLDLAAAQKSSGVEPRVLTSTGTVSSYSALPAILTKADKLRKPSGPPSMTEVLITKNSFQSPNEAYLLQVPSGKREKPTLTQVSRITSELVDKLHLPDAEEFWFSGAVPEQPVHGFMMKPYGYEEGKKYAMAFLVHGGPQGAWTSSWSTRWNPAVWAAAGYVTIFINPTGSTGYGQDFTDAINKDWGGKPFKDLVAGLEFVKVAYKDIIDTERMAMAGASYGGFMANWIQGHNDVTKFKTIICHDGILNTTSTWFSTEELYFPEHDLGGAPWEVPAEYEKWNPINHIRNWRTPQLIIHGGKDYRLPEVEGIGVFNALQRKGVPSKLVYFPNENHWVLNPLNSRKWHKEIFDWLNEWVGSGPSE